MDYAVRVSHYLDPASFELERDVILLVSDGRIVETIVGGEVSGGLAGLASNTLDLDAAVCLPGFVNCHAHLDLSHLWRQVPRGLRFHEWVPAVIAGRQVAPSIVQAGIDDGCRMLAATGTTAVLDVSVDGGSGEALARHGLRGIVALEVLGQADAAMQRADEIIRAKFSLEHERLGSDAGDAAVPVALKGVDYGFSPHAPYSTGAELYQQAYGRAFGEGRVCTTHVAETREELEFVKTGGGPLRELLQSLGVDVSSFKGHGETPITLLLRDWLGPWMPQVEKSQAGPEGSAGHATAAAPAGPACDSLVLVHGNYPEGDDLEWIARIKPSVCWCPRSHAYFEYDSWPWREYMQTGANLVIGTDSLASNDGLDMWGELAAAANTGAPLVELLRMATINGRRALGIAGDAADLAIWSLPTGAADKPLEGLMQAWLSEHPRLIASLSQGQLIARSV